LGLRLTLEFLEKRSSNKWADGVIGIEEFGMATTHNCRSAMIPALEMDILFLLVLRQVPQ
jgi:hypothetical protein